MTQSVDAVNRATRASILGLIAIGGIVLLLGLAAGALIARQIAGPLRRLDDAAERVKDGDLSARARVEGSEEQRSLATTFNQMTARLERLVEGQREFVADASHQLRTPLSGLRLRLEEARAVARDRETEEEIDGALAEVDRLAAMVTELLLLSPGRRGRRARRAGRPRRRRPPCRGALPRRASAPSAARRCRRSACAPADLDRALDVLVENALHYGGDTVTLVPRPGAIDVLDEGPGIDPAELEQVFERFHRGSAGRTGPPGTGLGLPIARELMRRWGGDVRLANRDGGGAAATLELPLDRAKPTPGYGLSHDATRPLVPRCPRRRRACRGRHLRGQLAVHPARRAVRRAAERRRRPRAPRHTDAGGKGEAEAHAHPASQGRSRATGTPTTVPVPTAAPTFDDHGGDRGGDDSSGKGSGGKGRDHPEDD